MSEPYKPDGYPSVAPYLVVEDPMAVVAFLTEAFDGTELGRYDRPDGSIAHVEVRIDDSVVMLGGANEDFPPLTTVVHVYVPDVDETYERAVAAGGVALEAPREREGEDDRRGAVEGPAGTHSSISTNVG